MISRRRILHGAACACAAAILPPVFVGETHAASAVPKTALSADQVLALLRDGNDAFVKGSCAATGAPARIGELAAGQAPLATIVGCSDSRTPPEQVFNRGLGELFVTRVAGNTVDAVALGSLEYGLAVLGTPLIVVLGHSQCGAVEAAVKAVKDKARFPGSIGRVVAPIIPAVRSVKGDGKDGGKGYGDLLSRAVRANVERTVAQIRSSRPLVAGAVKEGRAKVVGGVYDLQTGVVTFI
jgi:carbonic anhydrase